jgi:hypothetical protein
MITSRNSNIIHFFLIVNVRKFMKTFIGLEPTTGGRPSIRSKR